jgi:hypothetical protein
VTGRHTQDGDTPQSRDDTDKVTDMDDVDQPETDWHRTEVSKVEYAYIISREPHSSACVVTLTIQAKSIPGQLVRYRPAYPRQLRMPYPTVSGLSLKGNKANPTYILIKKL